MFATLRRLSGCERWANPDPDPVRTIWVTHGHTRLTSEEDGVKKSVKRARADRLQNEAGEGWQAAHELAGRLIQGWQPTPLHLCGVVLAPGERLNFDLQAGYARLYGGSGQYTHTTGMFWGSAGYMAAGQLLT